MSTMESIPGFVSVDEAARRLDVTPHRARALIRAGELDAARLSPRTTLVSAVSLTAYAQVGAQVGRPYDPKTAMAALWMLTGRQPSWLSGPQLRRAALYLSDASLEAFVGRVRKRALIVKLRIANDYLDEVRQNAVSSGLSALDEYDIDLTQNKGYFEGYVTDEQLRAIRENCFAVDDANGNAKFHITTLEVIEGLSVMPEAVVAADLAESLEARVRAAGLQRLGALIDGWQSDNGGRRRAAVGHGVRDSGSN